MHNAERQRAETLTTWDTNIFQSVKFPALDQKKLQTEGEKGRPGRDPTIHVVENATNN